MDSETRTDIPSTSANTYKKVSFVRSAAVPAVVLTVLVVGLSYFLPVWVGLGFVIVFLLWQLSAHYRELKLFALWLSHPTSKKVPSGHGVWTDIFAKLYALRRTDEKHEAQLAEWLERFQNTMRHLPDGVVIMDKTTQIEWANPVAERHFSLSLKRDLGIRLMNIVREPLLAECVQQRRHDAPFKMFLGNKHLEVLLINFEDERMILVSRDITETERVDAMRRDFIANASHELRTPLTVISGFLEHAQDEPNMPMDERVKQIDLMRQQAERMTVLIQDMLMLSRLESDVHVDAQNIDMLTLLNQQIQSAQALSAGRHQIHVDVSTINIKGSEQEISSVVGNLLSNAVRYTPEGGDIYLTWQMDANQQPTLTVRDTGLGIAPEHIPRLTERFYRVNTAQSRATKGTGLGLAIVKHVLIRHHAILKIESKLSPSAEQGTTFIVSFPA